MKRILGIGLVVVSLGVTSGCVHPKNYPQKVKEGIAGKKTPEAERENITYKQALDEMQVVHEREQKAGAVHP
jgi:hypothetical protein